MLRSSNSNLLNKCCATNVVGLLPPIPPPLLKSHQKGYNQLLPSQGAARHNQMFSWSPSSNSNDISGLTDPHTNHLPNKLSTSQGRSHRTNGDSRNNGRQPINPPYWTKRPAPTSSTWQLNYQRKQSAYPSTKPQRLLSHPTTTRTISTSTWRLATTPRSVHNKATTLHLSKCASSPCSSRSTKGRSHSIDRLSRMIAVSRSAILERRFS